MKIVILTPKLHFHSPLVLQKLFAKLIPQGVEFHVVLTPKLSPSGGKSWATPRNIIGVSGRRYLFLMALMKLKYDFFRMLEKLSRRPPHERRYQHPDEVCAAFGVPCTTLLSINSADSVTLLKEMKPDIIFSVFFNQILKEGVLGIPGIACVNLHPSFLPHYRGMSPVLWMLAEGVAQGGATLHYMNTGIDEGSILAQSECEILPQDSFFSAYEKTARLGAELAIEVFAKLPLPQGFPQPEGGCTRGPITAEAVDAMLRRHSFLRFKP